MARTEKGGVLQRNFNILEAVKNAYLFVWRQRHYLFRLSLIPLALYVATGLALYHYNPSPSLIEGFLWGLPASAVAGWLMFAEARFLLLGERIDSLPQDEGYRRQRMQDMKASVIVLLLFNMGVTAVLHWMLWVAGSKTFGQSVPATILCLFLVGGLVWGARFGVAHILAAVGYPIRDFLRRVHGMSFSFYLLGMGVLCVLPVSLAEQVFYILLAPPVDQVEPGQMRLITLASAPLEVVKHLLLNAAAAYALRDMLGGKGKGGLA